LINICEVCAWSFEKSHQGSDISATAIVKNCKWTSNPPPQML